LTWRLEFSARAQKELDRIPDRDHSRILFKLWELKSDPRPPGCLKLVNTPYWRLRQGNWRAIYEINDDVCRILVVRVLRRSESSYDSLH
jgi:mRNA interferase RelE/StbE